MHLYPDLAAPRNRQISRDVLVVMAARPMSLSQACSGPTPIVQTGADAMGFGHLSVVVLQDVGPVAMQYAGTAALQRRRVSAAIEPFAGRLDTDQPGVLVLDVGDERCPWHCCHRRHRP